jgi:general secretion pathway protein D
LTLAQDRTRGGYAPTATQANGTFPDAARRQCDDLLARARQAIKEDDLQTADRLVAQAESLGVQYGRLYMGDTPGRVRADLERKLPASQGGPFAGGAGQPADPFASRPPASVSNGGADAKTLAKSYIRNGRSELGRGNLEAAAHWHQLAARQQAGFGPSEDSPARLAAAIQAAGGRVDEPTSPAGMPSRQMMPLPPVDQVTPVSPPSSHLAQSDSLLLYARRALATGDVRRSSSLVEQARALNLQYRPGDDTPDRVDTLVRSYSDLMAQRGEHARSEAFRRRHAALLLEQAEGLLDRQAFDDADRLVAEAAKMNVPFGSYKTSPQNLQERIAAARRQAWSGGSGSPPAPSSAAQQEVAQLLGQARQAIAVGNLIQAEAFARRAQTLGVPETAFAAGQDRPGAVLQEILQLRSGGPSGVIPASGQYVTPATGSMGYDPGATRAVYDPAADLTHNRFAQNQQQIPTPAPPQAGMPAAGSAGVPSVGSALFRQGEAALRSGDTEGALHCFRQAHSYSNELDPVTQQRLQDFLQMLAVTGPRARMASTEPSMIDDAQVKHQLLTRQINSEVAEQESTARGLRESDPQGALALLEEAREKVVGAGLEPAAQDQLLRRIDRSLADTRNYIDENRPRIELDQRNRDVRAQMDRQREVNQDVQEKLALAVEEYNQLIREQRFSEAEVVAKRAKELDPTNPLTEQLVLMASVIRRYESNLQLQDNKEQAFWKGLDNVDQSSIAFDDNRPYVFGDATEWSQLTKSRQRRLKEMGRQKSEAELEIEGKLKTPVLLDFENAPLSRVMDFLAKLAQVNLHLDPLGLADQGISTEDPVTIQLSQEISLESALNLILEPRGLSHVIKDEVLQITSEQVREGQVYVQTYNVADLVMPIPNFVPSSMGLASAYTAAMGNAGAGGNPFSAGSAPLSVVASNSGAGSSAMIDPSVLAQMSSGGPGAAGPSPIPTGFGPGGMGGAAMADFDSLINLITSTVEPDQWDDVGGPGTIEQFDTNLSLVIRQTEEVHEQIVDLLAQLRRMQDLQVTIEVRFITLNDNFFERIGVDFDFDINDNIDRPFMVFGRPIDDISTEDLTAADVAQERSRDARDVDNADSVTVGMSAPGVFSADLDIPFTQNSYQLAVPQFGGFDATAGASLGFAILSDIEAFFFINAAQGDRRSNVLQAPKVTLFNGQLAFVSDTSQSPFVISVIPVVGDFAAAQQPVIVVLSEGTFLTVQAVVSNDRRFVRLTVVPFFSRIRDVNTFTFEGTTTSTEASSAEGNQDTPNDTSKNSRNVTTSHQGTTVQLPTFSFITVTTTVSVPDGGTVLLGGIKRLSEGRNEFGVPMLNKLPYINRLFKNVGIGRETQSLMMMVTPRIIIQEEEEASLGILAE